MAVRTTLPTSNLTFTDIKDTLNVVNTGNVTAVQRFVLKQRDLTSILIVIGLTFS